MYVVEQDGPMPDGRYADSFYNPGTGYLYADSFYNRAQPVPWL